MDNRTFYHMVSHLDEPRRYMSLTSDELAIVSLGLILLVVSNHKLLVGFLCFCLYGTLKHLKKGQGPRFLLILIYWHMPYSITQFLLGNVPASHHRVWRG